MEYRNLFDRLWIDYCNLNPSVKQIHKLLEGEGELIINDHIAFRTFDVPGISVDDISELILNSGYEEKGKYYFADKKLNAKHFEHKTEKQSPKVFISELITSEFSELVSNIAHQVAKAILKEKTKGQDILFLKNCWEPLAYSIYEKLRSESEYAAWLYAFGFRANHFTVFVNYLKKYNSIEKLNELLKSNGFKLNEAGGEIKGSESDGLKQSSILADIVDVKFTEGVYKIPCCYYEFAERYTSKDGKLFNGFIEKSANKIFESTNQR
jgi:hypothetical protein